MVFGVVPEHQGKGVDGAIIKVMSDVLAKKQGLRLHGNERNRRF